LTANLFLGLNSLCIHPFDKVPQASKSIPDLRAIKSAHNQKMLPSGDDGENSVKKFRHPIKGAIFRLASCCGNAESLHLITVVE
jgi:hypothetical protein